MRGETRRPRAAGRRVETMSRRLSLGYLMLPGLTPPELIRVAAEVGCSGVSISAALSTMMTSQASLLDSPSLRRETAEALRSCGVTLDLVEGVSVAAETDLTRARAALEVMRELGATRFNLSVWEPDAGRASALMDGLRRIAEDLRMRITIEFLRLSQVRTLADAAALCQRHHGLQILVDALHLARSGGTPADVAALPPELIGFCQICDGPADSPSDDAYFHEAMHERLVPGEGELPLHALLQALPAEVIVALEVPMRARAEAGVSPLERARLAADGARRLMA
jgi:sugar phosphate isomerase/epimerase